MGCEPLGRGDPPIESKVREPDLLFIALVSHLTENVTKDFSPFPSSHPASSSALQSLFGFTITPDFLRFSLSSFSFFHLSVNITSSNILHLKEGFGKAGRSGFKAGKEKAMAEMPKA